MRLRHSLHARSLVGMRAGHPGVGHGLSMRGGSFYMCVYIWCAPCACGAYAFAFMRARFCFLHTLLYVEVLHWVEVWGVLWVYEKGAALTAVPFCEVFCLYIYLSLCSMLSCGGFKPDTPYLTIVKGARIVKNVNNEERKLKTRS